MPAQAFPSAETASEVEARERVFDIFRRWGYLEANLDPLGHFPRIQHPELQVEGEYAEAARKIYAGTVAAEFMHIPDPERRR